MSKADERIIDKGQPLPFEQQKRNRKSGKQRAPTPYPTRHGRKQDSFRVVLCTLYWHGSAFRGISVFSDDIWGGACA